MGNTTKTDWKQDLLARLYEQHKKKPSAYRKLRLDPEQFPLDEVDEFFQEMVQNGQLAGNISHRNVKLTPRGVEFVNDDYPDVAQAFE